MKWIKSYTRLITDSGYMNLTAGSKALWHDCNLWCGLNEVDGIIPASDVKALKGTPSKIAGLINAGFWDETKTGSGEVGYKILGWVEDQGSKENTNKKRENGADRTARSRAKSASSGAQVETKSAPSGDQVEAKSASSGDQVETKSAPVGRHLSGPKGSDQHEQESVTPLEKRREDLIRRDESESATRPPGGTHTEAKTETKDEAKEESSTPPLSPSILSSSRFSPNTLSSRFSALGKGSAVVDVSASEGSDDPQGGAGDTSARQPGGQGDDSWDSREREIGKPLEQMSPSNFLRYIVLSQEELNGIKLSDSGSRGVATMRKFQSHYGPERAAGIVRYLFINERGRTVVGSNGPEHITQHHFSEALRWFTDKVDLKAQSKSRVSTSVSRMNDDGSGFTLKSNDGQTFSFASSL